MNNTEVERQINQMVTFIKQEAVEKATEIDVKADEEFSLEKSRMVQAEKVKIMKEFERKQEQAKVQQRIQHSNLIKESRLEVLRTRDTVLGDLFEQAKSRLPTLTANKEYPNLLGKLMLQGAKQLHESQLQVQCRQEDTGAVQRLIPQVQGRLQQELERKFTLTLHPQPAQCCGGIIMMAHNGQVKLDNTLEERLRLAFEAGLPNLQEMLLGKPEHRKYYD